MDPVTLIVVGLCASGAATALGMRVRKRVDLARMPARPPRVAGADRGDEVKVGDVLLYLGDEFWLAGALSIVREGATTLRIFSAPERGPDRFLAIPRDGRSVWVLYVDEDLRSIGWPGVEVPSGGRTLRRVEYGNAAFTQEGEGLTSWEGTGRFAVFRAHDGIAVVVEGPGAQRLALVGREIPRQLVEKMG
ncbi:MAG: hypothetical protein WCJ30_20270 [Deltaproteobacteria bacterium]